MLVQIKVSRDEDGVWCASGVDHGVHAPGATFGDLYADMEEATQLHFEEDLTAGKTIDLVIVAERQFAGAPGSRI